MATKTVIINTSNCYYYFDIAHPLKISFTAVTAVKATNITITITTIFTTTEP